MSDEPPAAEATLPAAVPAAAPTPPPEKPAEVAPADVAPTVAAEAVPAAAAPVDTPAPPAVQSSVVAPLVGDAEHMAKKNTTPESEQDIDLEKFPAWKPIPVPTPQDAIAHAKETSKEIRRRMLQDRQLGF